MFPYPGKRTQWSALGVSANTPKWTGGTRRLPKLEKALRLSGTMSPITVAFAVRFANGLLKYLPVDYLLGLYIMNLPSPTAMSSDSQQSAQSKFENRTKTDTLYNAPFLTDNSTCIKGDYYAPLRTTSPAIPLSITVIISFCKFSSLTSYLTFCSTNADFQPDLSGSRLAITTVARALVSHIRS